MATASHTDTTTAASTQDVTLTGLDAGTTYHVLVKASDAAGNVSTASTELTFDTMTPAP